MGLTLPAVPNLNVAPPQIANPLDQQAKMLQLKNLMGQQQLLPLQVQEAQQKVQSEGLANQKAQMELDSQKAMQKALAGGVFQKYIGSDAEGGTGFDANGLLKELSSNPDIMFEHAGQIVDQFQKRYQTQMEIAKTAAQAGEAQASIRGKGFEMLHQRVADALSASGDQQTTALQNLAKDLSHNPQLFAGVPQDDLAHVYAASQSGDLATLKTAAGALDVDKKMAETAQKQAEAITAQNKLPGPNGELSVEHQQELKKEKAEQPLKLQEATAKAQAEQMIKGLAEPGYAFDPKTGQTTLTDQTAYLQSHAQGGLQGFRKVGEKDIKDDTMLINRLGDVHQKVAEYEQALQKPISAKEQGNIAALLGVEPTKLNLHPGGELLSLFRMEVPMERVDAALNKENLKGLGANARDQLIAYRNAREAMMGYKTVLSGSSRGSDKSMDLLTQALPDPSITDPDFSQRSLGAFKQNLHIVGQGLPTLPGLRSPQQIEDDVWGKKQPTQSGQQPSAKKSKASQYGVEIQ